MADKWPPEGFDGPFLYERNKWSVWAIAGVVSILLVFSTFTQIHQGAIEFSNYVSGTGQTDITWAGWISYLILVFCLTFALLPIHERIHYHVGDLLNLNPKYGSREILGIKASVIGMTDNIDISENSLMVIPPFLVIGSLCFVIMTITTGTISGLSGLVLISHSASCAQDLYHILRFIRMPSGSRFRNYRENGELQTEYVTPSPEP